MLPLTTNADDAGLMRVPIAATPASGLDRPSFAMLDRMTTAERDKVSGVIGHADDAAILAVNRALAVFLAIA